MLPDCGLRTNMVDFMIIGSAKAKLPNSESERSLNIVTNASYFLDESILSYKVVKFHLLVLYVCMYTLAHMLFIYFQYCVSRSRCLHPYVHGLR